MANYNNSSGLLPVLLLLGLVFLVVAVVMADRDTSSDEHAQQVEAEFQRSQQKVDEVRIDPEPGQQQPSQPQQQGGPAPTGQ